MKDANELINLLYEPMDSDVIINLLDVLKLPQPMIDEQYYEDRYINIDGKETVGLGFIFQEIIGSISGIPLLTAVTFYPHCNYCFEHEIKMSDSFTDILQKVGYSAPYRNKFLKKNRIWIFIREDGKKYIFSINFEDIALTTIKSIVTLIFKEESKTKWISLENENDTI